MSTKFIRYSQAGTTSYGILEGDTIQELKHSYFLGVEPSGRTIKLSAVKLLSPCEPSKVIAVGLNYKSHLEGEAAPTQPGIFLKLPTCVIAAEENIVFPPGAEDVHYEGEMVVVIGKRRAAFQKRTRRITSLGSPAGMMSAKGTGRTTTCNGSAARRATRLARSGQRS